MTTIKMHRKLPRQFFIAFILASSGLLFSGCVSNQTPMEVETPAADQDTSAVETHPLDQEQAIDSVINPVQSSIADPWLLVQESIGKPPSETNALLLTASELFLDQRHFSTAYTMLEEIDPAWLDKDQRQYFALIRARYALLNGQINRARSLLAQIPRSDTMSQQNYIRVLRLDIAIAAQKLDFMRAVSARIELDTLLNGQAQLENQQGILSTLVRERQLYPDTDNTVSSRIQGWQALAALRRQGQLNDLEIAAWQLAYPGHPARAIELAAIQQPDTISSNQIALLLPITSKLGRAAEAFKRGFDAAVTIDGRFEGSRVYDIGSETDLVGFYYQSAVNDGADFIIGPLGRTGTQSMLEYLKTSPHEGVSTLILGELTAEQVPLSNVWGLSLSPEQDATAIAERAISSGLRNAVVMQKNNAWGARLASAFTLAFESKGGKVVSNQRFQPNLPDHSTEVKSLLDISSSENRHKQLQNMLGTKLKFSVRRRNDVDFVFLAGNARDARRIVPLLKFYRAHDLPIYASSSAYNGKFNKLTDEDMKGMEFTDLPWLLDKQLEIQIRERQRLELEKKAADARAQALAQGLIPSDTEPTTLEPSTTTAVIEADQTMTVPVSVQAPGEIDMQASPEDDEETIYEGLPFASATLNRLYALGFSAFQSIPQLTYLQSDEWYQFDTRTMSLNMDKERNLRHQVAWGKYASDGIERAP